MIAADRARPMDPEEEAFVREDGRELAAVEATGCPSPSMLRAAAVGALPAEMATAVTAHTRSCAICRQLSSDLLELDTDLDALEDSRIRRAITRGRRVVSWRPWAAAAVVFLAAGATLLTLTPVAAVPARPADPARSRPTAAVVDVLTADKLPAVIDAAALLWRGSEHRFETDLATALRPYMENDFKAAGTALERVASQYPTRPEPLLYLGISRLLMDRPADAEKALRRAVSLGGTTLDEARWYLAVASYQNGNRPDARSLLATLCSGSGERSAQACAAQAQLGDQR